MIKIKKTNLVINISLLAVSILISISGVLLAWDGENVPIDTIRPTSEFRPFYAENQNEIQKGRLIGMSGDTALIDGERIRISSAASFFQWNGEPMKKGDFVLGFLVGFQVDKSGNINTMWDLSPESMPSP